MDREEHHFRCAVGNAGNRFESGFLFPLREQLDILLKNGETFIAVFSLQHGIRRHGEIFFPGIGASAQIQGVSGGEIFHDPAAGDTFRIFRQFIQSVPPLIEIPDGLIRLLERTSDKTAGIDIEIG